MEKWHPYEQLNLDIYEITSYIGSIMRASINFTTENKSKHTLFFEGVLSLKYTTENGFINRFHNVPGEVLWNNSIFVVEDSEYLKDFKYEVSGTIPIDDVRHFIIFDTIDTGIEILTTHDPILDLGIDYDE